MKYNLSRKYRLLLMFTTLIQLGTSCKKLVEVDPPVTNYTETNVYSSDATAIAVLTGIYASMGTTYSQTFTTGPQDIAVCTGLSSDEFTLYQGVTDLNYVAYYRNALTANGTITAGSLYWIELYNKIFICNAAIEGLSKSNGLSTKVLQQLTGEARFMRAFFYFYLVNLYGDIPLITTTNYKVNATLRRTEKDEVYHQIITDLKEASNLLSSDYLDGNLKNYTSTPERTRPTKWAATALLARAYLFNNDYLNAETQASQVIDHTSQYSLTGLNDVFLKNNNEAIWQLQPVNTGRNTEEAFTFIIPTTGPSNNNPVYCSPYLLNAFELNDQRKVNWIDTLVSGVDTFYYPAKYKSALYGAPVTEYLVVLRLAEQYLIRAEARAQLGNLPNAAADLDKIRMRAALSEISSTIATSKSHLLDAIFHERQSELFSEWGHRWLDLKRTGRINTVMATVTPQKGGVWNSNWQLYPIPPEDIQKNKNIIQNPGY